MTGLPFPNIDPNAFSIGPLHVKWYALAYVAGILGGAHYIKVLLSKKITPSLSYKDFDAFVGWAIFAIIIGGRLGFVLFYEPQFYIEHPEKIIKTWEGGMSFHGAVIALVMTAFFYAKKRRFSPLSFFDYIAMAAPIGLFLGRIANFINGELYGTITALPWGICFPGGGYLPRHPSQLYEAIIEGIFLFFLLYYQGCHHKKLRLKGYAWGLFLAVYGAGRFIVEFVRDPLQSGGYILSTINLAQILCIPMILLGLFYMKKAYGSRP